LQNASVGIRGGDWPIQEDKRLLMNAGEIYEETVSFPVAWAVFGLFMVISVVFVALWAYQLTSGPVGSDPAPTWFYLVMWLVFDLVGILMLNFTKLRVSIFPSVMRIGFGVIRYSVRRSNVAGCYRDRASGMSYGGWGIRIARIDGKWRLGYTVIGASRVVLQLTEGRFSEFAFSTNEPDRICEIVKQVT
jgi:hypothetical protein